MWTKKEMTISSPSGDIRNFECGIKHFEERSVYGIDGGRISKLWVRDKETKKIVINYDRGWDIKPETECEKAALKILIKLYN